MVVSYALPLIVPPSSVQSWLTVMISALHAIRCSSAYHLWRQLGEFLSAEAGWAKTAHHFTPALDIDIRHTVPRLGYWLGDCENFGPACF
ncbi:hypothetical protein F4777DRAFT_223260 [Nemania sp. FL0916]|nr:hypothetical protein F4777DRAFT_223260 [Nemania sp. FL0916]